ncbi:hypothetical protein [Embleya sp. AB8]|uniref:hypothetical protein n=1 Tax=Embleya sp. AB8 TaxID=3156304 RepID=UPI003C76683D
MGRVAAGGGFPRRGVLRMVIVVVALGALLGAAHGPGVGRLVLSESDRCTAGAARPGDVDDSDSARDDAPVEDPGGRAPGSVVGTGGSAAGVRMRPRVSAASVRGGGSPLADESPPAVRVSGGSRVGGSQGTPSRSVVLRC